MGQNQNKFNFFGKKTSEPIPEGSRRENRKNEKLWLRVTQLESQPQISDHKNRKNAKQIAAASYASPNLSHKSAKTQKRLRL